MVTTKRENMIEPALFSNVNSGGEGSSAELEEVKEQLAYVQEEVKQITKIQDEIDAINEVIETLDGGSEDFICTITADSNSTGSVNYWTSDKTFEELTNAYDSGKNVRVFLGDLGMECVLAGRVDYELRYVCFTFSNSMGAPSGSVTINWFNISSSGVVGRVGFIQPTT